VGTSLFTGA